MQPGRRMDQPHAVACNKLTESALAVMRAHARRGHATRKRLHAKQKGRLLRHVANDSCEAREAAVRVIQRFWRGSLARVEAAEQRRAVVRIQVCSCAHLQPR